MDIYLIVKKVHILSATILFGTGLGIAFFMFRLLFANDIREKSYALRTTVPADYVFTAPAVILQPLSGAFLIWKGGFDPHIRWLTLTYGLYALAGLCWLPVVGIQIRLKHILQDCVRSGRPLPLNYYRLFRIWFLLGWLAFVGLVVIFFLMVAKPA